MSVHEKTASKKTRDPSGSGQARRPTRAELIWDGKYDDNGRRIGPLRVALPFQTVETVNESAHDRQKGFQFGAGFREEAWRNRLIWGDKKYVLPSLLSEFAGKVNLIYIDPPFDTGADFSFTATVPDDPDVDDDDSFTFVKLPSIIEHKAYRDIWGHGLNSYVQWFYEAIVVLHELLHETGSIYVHCDTRVNSYVRLILNEVFGADNFVNQITWRRTGAHNDPGRYGMISDSILFFKKGESYTWNQPYSKRSFESVEKVFRYAQKPDGTFVTVPPGEKIPAAWRRFQSVTLRSPHPRPNLTYVYKGYKPHKNGWSVNIERMKQYDAENRLIFPNDKEGAIRLKMYLDESPGVPVQDLWTDINKVEAASQENLNYPTQKPESLLERIVSVSSNEGDTVLDCFCGSGTTVAASERLGRKWVGCDLGRFAIHTTRKRLLSIPNVHPFVVQNLGKYERQVWAGTEFGDNQAAERQRAYIQFILKLAQAAPLNGYTWLHGVKAGRIVHVGAVDAPVSVGDVTQIAAEFKRAIGTGKDAPTTNGVDVLGWDFAFELNEVMKQQAATANIHMRFLRIPRDVMDKRAVEQGDIKFFELAALSVEVKSNKRNVFLKLKDFVIPPDDVPEDARKAVKHWSQWIDYWAVDWDNRSDTFHNEWQTYRTRKDKSLQLEITHAYPDPGDYTIVVR
jgi:adenine-specific DNA-methyltransferase